MKKILLSILALVMAFALAVPVFATNNDSAGIPEARTDLGELIDEVTYYDEELDATITERTYVLSGAEAGAITPLNDNTSPKWFTKEKIHQWSGSGKTTTIYAKGYFSWGNGDVSVSNATGGYDYFPPSLTIVNAGPAVTGTGRYGLIFNKYAYVTYTVNYINFMNNAQSLSVTIRISESGNNI